MTKRKLLWLAVLISVSVGGFAQSKPSVEDARSRLKVRASSDKSVYKVGEPILLTITLRNEGDDIVWVSKPYGVGRYPGEFYINVVGPDGSPLPNKSPVMAVSRSGGPSRSSTGIVQDFLRERVPFSPGDFWGVTRNIEDAYVSIKTPGRYQLTASFNESPIENLSKDELQALMREVKFPIQTKSLVSETVILEIR